MTDDRRRVIPSLVGMLKDVDLTGLQHGDTIRFDSTRQKFIPSGMFPATVRAKGSGVATGVTSKAVTLDHTVGTGDVIIVMLYTNAGTPGNVTVTGLGATWTINNQGQFVYAIGTNPTAGLDTLTVGYPFSSNFTILAAAFENAADVSAVVTNGVGPTTLDAASGAPSVSVGKIVVIGWALYINASGVAATSSFTDFNGTYTQLPLTASGNAALVEMGYLGVVPASGATDHVGNRGDSAQGSGGRIVLNHA